MFEMLIRQQENGKFEICQDGKSTSPIRREIETVGGAIAFVQGYMRCISSPRDRTIILEFRNSDPKTTVYIKQRDFQDSPEKEFEIYNPGQPSQLSDDLEIAIDRVLDTNPQTTLLLKLTASIAFNTLDESTIGMFWEGAAERTMERIGEQW